MDDSDRAAISEMLRQFRRETKDGYDALERVRYWLEHLDTDAARAVEEYFRDVALNPGHEDWSDAVEVLSWKGWRDREGSAARLFELLKSGRLADGSRRNDVLRALMRMRYQPALPECLVRVAMCIESHSVDCAPLAAHLAYLDPERSMEAAAEILHLEEATDVQRWLAVAPFVLVYLDLDPALLLRLAAKMRATAPGNRSAFIAALRKELTSGPYARESVELVLRELDRAE